MRERTRYALARPARSRPDRFTLLLAAIAALGAGLILARQITCGVGLYADWATYLSVAESLLAGEGFVQIHGWPYLHWPPLYPMLLAAASLFAFAPYDVAGPLNAAVFGLTIFVAGRYLRRHVQHRFLVVWACLAIMLAIPLTRVASHAVSEAPFILFMMLSLVRTSGFLDTGKRSDLIWAAAFASLAILTRYIGVTLIVAALLLLLFQRGVVPLEKAKRIGLYLSIAVPPVALWLLRNVLVHGRYGGRRNPSPYTLPEILDKYLSDLGGWVFLYLTPGLEILDEFFGGLDGWVFLYLTPGNARVAAAALAGAALLALALSVGRAFVRSCRKAGNGAGWSPFHLFGGFALVYLVFFTALQAAIELDPLGGRYLSPVYIPLLFAAVFALDKALGSRQTPEAMQTGGRPAIGTRADKAAPLAVAVGSLLFLWLSAGAALNMYEIRRNNEGMDMGAAVWLHSETLRYVAEHLLEERIFSNAASVIYLGTDHEDYHPVLPRLDTMRRDIENAAPGAYVVWMDAPWRGSRKYSPHLAVLRELLGLERVAWLSYGSIWRATRGGGDPAPAFFFVAVAPMAGEPFGVGLSAWVECKRSEGQPWRWERGGDATGWTRVMPRRETWRYTPTAADVGHRLRASVDCTDKNGKTIRAMTAPSAPVVPFNVDADASRAGDALAAWYRSNASGEPVIRSTFDVYLDGRALTYVKEPCARADTGAVFFLHLIPADAADLPDHRKQYGFDNLDFDFDGRGVRFDGECLATIVLPDYAVARIRTGQYLANENGSYTNLWEGEIRFDE